MSRSAWLKRTPVVPQESSELWNFTILDNTAFGCTDAALVEKEAELCGVTNFVEIDTYSTKRKKSRAARTKRGRWIFQGAKGNQLRWQGGFAELSQQGCFVLDEPSSALDPDRELELFYEIEDREAGEDNHIRDAYFENMPDVRSSKGCLVQVGTHNEVMKDEDGMYARLYKLQDQIIK